jgi:hypothetical protein
VYEDRLRTFIRSQPKPRVNGGLAGSEPSVAIRIVFMTTPSSVPTLWITLRRSAPSASTRNMRLCRNFNTPVRALPPPLLETRVVIRGGHERPNLASGAKLPLLPVGWQECACVVAVSDGGDMQRNVR